MKMGITFAILRSLGYLPAFIERLKMLTSVGASIEAESLMNLVEKLSYPVELVFLRDFIIFIISG